MTASVLQQLARHPGTRQTAASLVVLCLLMQSVLAFLVTPMAVSHDTEAGKVTIVLCTLQGTKSVTVDMPEFASDGPEICPALELNHIAGSASLAAPPPALAPLSLARAVPVTALSTAHRALHYAAFSSRAPPVIPV